MKYRLNIQMFGEIRTLNTIKNISTITEYSPTQWTDSTGAVLGSAVKELLVTPTENIVTNGIQLQNWSEKSQSTTTFGSVVLPTEIPINNTDGSETLNYSTTFIFHYFNGSESKETDTASISKEVTYYTPFVGYSTLKDSKMAQYLPGDKYTPSSDSITLYGVWGNQNISEKILSEIDIKLPVSSKQGYRFGGWYTGENGTGKFLGYGNQEAKALQNIEVLNVYAYWLTLEPRVIDYNGKIKNISECYYNLQGMWINRNNNYMQEHINDWYLRS